VAADISSVSQWRVPDGLTSHDQQHANARQAANSRQAATDEMDGSIKSTCSTNAIALAITTLAFVYTSPI